MKTRSTRNWTYSIGLGYTLLAVMVGSRANATEVYSSDFDAPLGTKYPEWTSSIIRYRSAADPPGTGEIESPEVTNCKSPSRQSSSGAQHFLGEFGGPKIGTAADPGYNRTLVEQTIRLTLPKLPPHRTVRLALDLYVLKSWDGNSPQYGPDRLRIAVADGETLVDSSFSNNHKVDPEGSDQDFPNAKSTPQSAAVSTNTLGYQFFGDAIYHLEFSFPHDQESLKLDFTSSLFEGKGIDDESWGIDNVRIEIVNRLSPHSNKPR